MGTPVPAFTIACDGWALIIADPEGEVVHLSVPIQQLAHHVDELLEYEHDRYHYRLMDGT